MATGNQREASGPGNLNIIHVPGEEGDAVDTSKVTKSNDIGSSSQITKKETEDTKKELKMQSIYFEGGDAIKLMFFYNEEINRLRTFPNVKIVTQKDKSEEFFVLITFPPSRKEQFETEGKKLQKLIDGLLEKIVDCKNEEGMRNAVQQFKRKKSTEVLPQPDWEDRKIYLYSKDDKRMNEAIKSINCNLSEKSLSPQKPVTSSRAGRKFSDSTKTQSKYERQDSEEDTSPSSPITSSQVGRKFGKNFGQSSDHDESSEDDEAYSSNNTKTSSVKFEFSTKEGLKVKLYKGSITKLDVDAIVNAANEHLKNIGGVALAISKAAGKALEDGCREEISKKKFIDVSKNCVTVSGNLPCRFVIHAVGPAWYSYNDKRKCLDDLSDTVLNILKKSQKRKFKVVVMPPISSGIFAVPKKFCAAMYLKGIMDFSRKSTGKRHVEEFHIIDIQDEMLDLIKTEYQRWKKDPLSIDPTKLLQGNISKGPRSYQRSDSSENQWKDEATRSNNSKGSRPYQRSDSSENQWKGEATRPKNSNNYDAPSNAKMIREESGHVSFVLNGNLKVRIYSGNLVNLAGLVDVIVSTENCKIDGTGGLASALLNNCGKMYIKEHSELLSGHSRLPEGQVLMSHAGTLKCRNIFHVVIEQFQNDTPPTWYELQKQKNSVSNVLEKANTVPLTKTDKKHKPYKKGGVSTIAMALFGSGKLTTPLYVQHHCEKVYEAISDFAYHHTIQKDVHLTEIHLVNMKSDITDLMMEVFKKNSTHSQVKGHTDPSPSGPVKNYGGYDKWKGDSGVSSAGTGYGKFDPEKLLHIDTWKMKPVSYSKSMEIEAYIEPVGKPRHTGGSETLSSTEQRGNLKLIQSNMTMSYRSQKADKMEKLSEIKGNFECVACKMEKDKGFSLNCTHNICIFCQPGYGNVCPDPKCNSESKAFSKTLGATPSVAMGDIENDMTDSCVICMDDMIDVVQFKQCKHQFCRDCISQYFSTKAACPVCNTVYGIVYGTQPKSGSARVYRDKQTFLPGYSRCDSLIIDYNFSDGIQEECHPNPGTKYKGLRRQAYLPDNKEGRKVLELLRRAFEQRLTFTVGRSRTTGEENVLTWNDIHHKTRREGGPEKFGYPDEDYFKRVTEELEAKGIYHKERNNLDF